VISFTCVLAAYFSLVLNFPLLANITHVLKGLGETNIGLMLTVPLSLFSLLTLLFLVFTVKYLEKPFFILLTLISSIVSYATYHYGVIFNADMLDNILQTNYGEGASYLTAAALLWVGILGVLPAILIARTRIIHPPYLQEVGLKLLLAIAALLLLLLIGVCYYKDYASVIRNNTQLQKMIIPTQWGSSAFGYVKKNYFSQPVQYKYIGTDAKNMNIGGVGKKNLLILVIGETARSKNFSLNGYPHDTNQYTKKQDVIFFKQVRSCGTSTSVSLPCMFSNLTRRAYSHVQADNQDNLLDIVQRAQVNVLWLDNDAGCKGVCKHIPTIDIKPTPGPWCDGSSCYDQALLENLNERINALQGQDSVIVLHLIGSHGPSYFKRYPDAHRVFTPDCPRSDIQNCSQQHLINTYDNTILYTDFILNELIGVLKQQHEAWNTSLLYLSDHGESFGEKGLYLHGAPYALAPDEQIDIPWLAWFSDSFAGSKSIDLTCLKDKAANARFSHDNLFHSVLGLLDIQTREYQKNLDIFNSCRS